MSGERRFTMNGIEYRFSIRPDMSKTRPIRLTCRDAYERTYMGLSPAQAIRLARALESAAREAS